MVTTEQSSPCIQSLEMSQTSVQYTVLQMTSVSCYTKIFYFTDMRYSRGIKILSVSSACLLLVIYVVCTWLLTIIQASMNQSPEEIH